MDNASQKKALYDALEKAEKNLFEYERLYLKKINPEQAKNVDLVYCNALDFLRRQADLKNRMFGYPGHLCERSFIVNYLRRMESEMVLANNCGEINDTYSTNSENHYLMDTKTAEREIVALVAGNLGITGEHWGYVTSGGSESNAWGIEQAFRIYPDGVLLFCEAAHYSVKKIIESRNHQYVVMPQNNVDDESIDLKYLFAGIRKIWLEQRRPINLLLTFGTTKFGSCDDIAAIMSFLCKEAIPHYIHIDAAIFGGIPANQINAPKIAALNETGYDSISVSLHKYIGYPQVKSVIISKTLPKRTTRVDYIGGQIDSTISGSRDIPPFSLRQHIFEVFNHSPLDEYSRNIELFESLLMVRTIPYIRNQNSNIFVFRVNKPKQCDTTAYNNFREICNRWQLMNFTDIHGHERVHIMMFPNHDAKAIETLADDIIKIIS